VTAKKPGRPRKKVEKEIVRTINSADINDKYRAKALESRDEIMNADTGWKPGGKIRYTKNHCQILYDNMSKGLSFEACCGVMGITADQGDEWKREHRDFGEAYEVGLNRGLLFDEISGQMGIDGSLKGFAAGSYNFSMKNKRKWRDKEVDEKGVERPPIVINLPNQDKAFQIKSAE
jgi:hypothetical protein